MLKILLVVVDTIAAPLYMLSVSCNKYIISEIKTGNARFHALIRLDFYIFDQNILSFENTLF